MRCGEGLVVSRTKRVKLIAIDDVAEAEKQINQALDDGYELSEPFGPSHGRLRSGDHSVVMLALYEVVEDKSELVGQIRPLRPIGH